MKQDERRRFPRLKAPVFCRPAGLRFHGSGETLDIGLGGARIFAELKLPLDGRRRYVGLLKSIAGDAIVVEVDGKSYELPFERIQKARLRPE